MSVQTAINEVQAAVYALLVPSGSIDTTLASLGVVGVFDWRKVPQNQPFDYVTLGDITETPENTLGRRGYVLNFAIHIWSRYLGTQAPSAMLERINELIDQEPLTLATHAHVSTRYQRTKTYADQDGLTIHLIAQYQIFVQE
jgi:hypothetical protein